MEATTVESVTLALVEASLGTLDSKSLSETTAYLEEEPDVLAGEKRTEEEDGVASEEKTEALKILKTDTDGGTALFPYWPLNRANRRPDWSGACKSGYFGW